jgi:hypothetical protein
LTELAAAEETLQGFIEAVGERLHRALGDVFAAAPLEAVHKIVAAEKRARSLVMRLERFEHLIVKETALCQAGEEHRALGACGKEPVLEGLVHLFVLLDIRTRRNRFCPVARRRRSLTPASGNIHLMDQRDLLTLESAVTAIEEAASAVAREVERDRLRETSLTRLSTVEAELNRSRLALEKIIREETS